jgi:hypothetical protein
MKETFVKNVQQVTTIYQLILNPLRIIFRSSECCYSIIGCQWKGPIHESKQHEAACAHPKKSGADVMAALKDREAKYSEEKKLFSCLVDLLSYEKITFNGEFYIWI